MLKLLHQSWLGSRGTVNRKSCPVVNPTARCPRPVTRYCRHPSKSQSRDPGDRDINARRNRKCVLFFRLFFILFLQRWLDAMFIGTGFVLDAGAARALTEWECWLQASSDALASFPTP